MQRRTFLHLSALAAAGFSIDPAQAASLLQPKPPATPRPWPAPFDSGPVLQNPAADSITIAIAVNALSTAWVEHGTSPSSLNSRADASRHGLLPLSSRFHSIRLTDLKPATTYSYRFCAAPIDFQGPYKITRAPTIPSKTFTFTTLDPARSRASLSIINDTHENPETLKGVTGQLAANPADLLFWNGDIFNDVRSDEQIIANTFRPADTDYAANTPLCFVSGNHDVRGIHARFLDLFLTTPDNRRHYILRQGPIAILVLDTGEDKLDSHAVYAGLNDFARYRAAQKQWLEIALQSEAWRSAPFRLAILHIPLFGGGSSEDSREKWHAILAAAGVTASINGHIHKHSYTPANANSPYAQLVGGGPAPESATVIRAEADEKQLALIVRDLAGKEIGNYEFKRV